MKKMGMQVAALLLIAGAPLVAATQQAPAQTESEQLTAKQVRDMEKTAITAADHERLAGYYQSKAVEAEKNLEAAQALEQQWGAAERASKTPDPYPHAKRLVAEYSEQVRKYAHLAADHEWVAEKYEMAARAAQDGVASNAADITNPASSTVDNKPSGKNAFVLGPKGGPGR